VHVSAIARIVAKLNWELLGPGSSFWSGSPLVQQQTLDRHAGRLECWPRSLDSSLAICVSTVSIVCAIKASFQSGLEVGPAPSPSSLTQLTVLTLLWDRFSHLWPLSRDCRHAQPQLATEDSLDPECAEEGPRRRSRPATARGLFGHNIHSGRSCSQRIHALLCAWGSSCTEANIQRSDGFSSFASVPSAKQRLHD